MASACGPDGHVAACEPDPLLDETYLPQNLALDGFRHGIEICPKVVGNLDDRPDRYKPRAVSLAQRTARRRPSPVAAAT